MNKQRRLILKTLMQGGAALGALVAAPGAALAAWVESAFTAKSMDEAMKNLLGGNNAQDSDKVRLEAPAIAENGAVVPIKVSSSLSNVESISIFVKNNPTPLVASFDIPPGTEPKVAVRIRMGKTSPITAVVKAGGKLYSTTKETKVTIGGCGG